MKRVEGKVAVITGKSTRLVAIEAGWQKADKQIKRLNKLSTVSDIDTGKP